MRTSTAGSPQGGVISPLLANVYLDDFDRTWEATCADLGRLVRYADDFVVLCRTKAQAEQALRRVRKIMSGLQLSLHPTKTKLVELGLGQEGFEFLGCYLRIVRSHFKGRRYLFRWPSPRAMKSVRVPRSARSPIDVGVHGSRTCERSSASSILSCAGGATTFGPGTHRPDSTRSIATCTCGSVA